MKEFLVLMLKIAAPLSVGLLMFAQGMSIEPRWVGRYFKERPWLVVRSLLAALVLVPAAALAIILVMKPAIGPTVGLAILMSCPPAPLMLRNATEKGGATAAFMATLHLSLAVLAFVTVPAVLSVLALQLGFHADVDLAAMAVMLMRTIIGPLGLGLAVHAFAPQFAEKRISIVTKVGSLVLLVAVLIALLVILPAMWKMDPWSYLVFLVVCVVALAIGHWLGPEDPNEKTALAVECAVRHPGLAITIGAANYGMAKALPVLLPCTMTFIIVTTIYLKWRAKSLAGGKPGNTAAPEQASA